MSCLGLIQPAVTSFFSFVIVTGDDAYITFPLSLAVAELASATKLKVINVDRENANTFGCRGGLKATCCSGGGNEKEDDESLDSSVGIELCAAERGEVLADAWRISSSPVRSADSSEKHSHQPAETVDNNK